MMKKNGKSLSMSEAPTPSSSSPVSLPATTTTGGAVGAGGSSAGLLAGGPSIAAAVVTGSVVAANTPSSHQGHQQHRFSRLGMAPKAHQSRTDDPAKIFKLIDDNVIGKSAVFLGPYGRRKVVYADYTSSGRSLQFLEDYIIKEVLPAYGDMNCASAVTGLQSQLYYNEVRSLVKSAVNAGSDDEIIFCDGSYASPIERLCFLLCCNENGNGLNQSWSFGGGYAASRDLNSSSGVWGSYNEQQASGSGSNSPKINNGPVVFVSTCEIPATLQPWLDAGAQIERISKNREGYLDLDDLARKLSKHQSSQRLLIGLFSSASRLTGILADDVATTILLHQYGAISIWDYSHGAPFAPIQTNSPLPGANKDVVFFSASKFVGGVQAPGVLVVKKNLLSNLNVTSFNDSVGVIMTVRAGLVIQLKESLGVQNIMNRLEKICKQMLAHIRTIPEIVLLGPNSSTAKRMATICFLMKHPRGTFLHNRFVVAVLNDVFGIQATAGAHIGYAMGINEKLAVEYERVLMDDSVDLESIRPGYTRISLPYFMSDNEIAFILEALKMVATEAWKLLPQYECDNKTGEWRHHSNSLVKERKWLGAIRYTDGKMQFADRKVSGPGVFPQNYQECLQTARNLFNRARKMAHKSSESDAAHACHLKSAAESLRWYMLPGEAHELLLGHSHHVKNIVPFDPNAAALDSISFIMHRHNSLSALDIKKFMSRSVPLSPVQSARHQSTPSPVSPVPRPDFCLSTLNFSLGGEVTPDLAPICSPKVTHLINSDNPANSNSASRHRCNTWTSSAFSMKILARKGTAGSNNRNGSLVGGVGGEVDIGLTSQMMTMMGPMTEGVVVDDTDLDEERADAPPTQQATSTTAALIRGRRRRVCSCSSQTDHVSFGSSPTPPGTSSPTASLLAFSVLGSSINDCSEDIQAYVKEVTQDIATEIKSELREVISQVDNVLENTDPMDGCAYTLATYPHMACAAEELKNSDAVSASDVAQYLREFSIEMASEVKSEIREVCAKVEDFNSNEHNRRSSPTDLDGLKRCLKGVMMGEGVPATQRRSDTVIGGANQRAKAAEGCDLKPSRSESFPNRCVSGQEWQNNAASAGLGNEPRQQARYTGAISKLSDSSETASRDSGINMCFPETDGQQHPFVGRSRIPLIRPDSLSIGSSSETDELSSSSGTAAASSSAARAIVTGQQQPPKRQQSDPDSSASSDNDINKWHNLPKDLWKQASEAMDEFDMLGHGDRVLVALSGSSASLCLLHALRQFGRARNINIELAACSVGAPGIDPRALMLYLRDLGVQYYYEEPTENVHDKLAFVARKFDYNVLAVGTTLDKVAHDFIVSVLLRGQLHATQAHCYRGNDLRIIRPLIYARERSLEDIARNKDLPSRPSRMFNKAHPAELGWTILRGQEATNPAVYENIKSALKPLLAVRLDHNETSSYETLRLALLTRK